MAATTDPPLPPFELVNRVFPVAEWSEPYRVYQQMGAETKDALLQLLPADWSFVGKRVLDFGCGSGRTLRHFLPEAADGEFWGTEIDEPSVRWLQSSLCPPLHVWKSAQGPPLGLEPASFDLIWSISVFTHLPQWTSLQWLIELHRLLKPGGLLIATYYGRWNSAYLAGEEWDENRIGMNVLRHNQDWDHGGPVVLMSDWWVDAHWGRAFDILGRLDRFHNFTWVLMQKRDVDLTPEDLEAPADDPREHRALRHNLRQVQREVDILSADMRRLDARQREDQENSLKQIRQLETEVRAEYESSISWRLTTPLRAGARRVRQRIR